MGEWVLVILSTIDFLATLLTTSRRGSNPPNKEKNMINTLLKKLAEKFHKLMLHGITKAALLVLELWGIHPYSHIYSRFKKDSLSTISSFQ